MKYTIKDFHQDFPNDRACLAFIFKKRYPDGLECPKCRKKDFYPIEGRRAYASPCGYQTYPTEGTIFHKSPTSLVSWFHAIFLMSQSKNGVSAMEIMRQIGVTYKCAWRIAKQIRSLMKGKKGPLFGIVEVDETRIGGKTTGQGTHPASKTIVMGELQRGGEIRLQVIPDTTHKSVLPNLTNNVYMDPMTEVMTDSWHSYEILPSMGFRHSTVNHRAGEYVRGRAYTNTIEGFWSQLKRSIHGTYHSVSRKHLPSYLDEFSFRYDHRADAAPLPVTLFSRVGMRA